MFQLPELSTRRYRLTDEDVKPGTIKPGIYTLNGYRFTGTPEDDKTLAEQGCRRVTANKSLSQLENNPETLLERLLIKDDKLPCRLLALNKSFFVAEDDKRQYLVCVRHDKGIWEIEDHCADIARNKSIRLKPVFWEPDWCLNHDEFYKPRKNGRSQYIRIISDNNSPYVSQCLFLRDLPDKNNRKFDSTRVYRTLEDMFKKQNELVSFLSVQENEDILIEYLNGFHNSDLGELEGEDSPLRDIKFLRFEDIPYYEYED
jgi:hypothetical protein